MARSIGTDTAGTYKVRENRIRRMSERQGLKLVKSRRRDPYALDYGGYGLIDPGRNEWVAGATPTAYSMDLDQVEAWLRGGHARGARGSARR